uniref:PurM-like C-terminal domain-containing protein n=1 Tax=Panagrolaimus sp. PS1159 TaxID=55785 RepID=A0AC35EW32_9BILA
RLEVVSKFMAGFHAGAKFADVEVRGGQTVECPWMMLGGVGTAVVPADALSTLNGAIPGDVLVLTKPLGVRAAVNAHQWLHKSPERLKYQSLSESSIRDAYSQACIQMASHNLVAATFLKEFNAHASTDVTGFGIIGHADNLAKAQNVPVHFIIDTFPMIPYTDIICKSFPNANGFNMFDGLAAETSGGLLIAFNPSDAPGYIEKLKEFGITAHIVGHVEKSPNNESDALLNPKGVKTIMDNGFALLHERPEL